MRITEGLTSRVISAHLHCKFGCYPFIMSIKEHSNKKKNFLISPQDETRIQRKQISKVS